METAANTAAIFNQYRGLLFAIAYRMLSSASDAEDVVQEAFVRWLQANPADVQSARAYLSAVVVRLCIDESRSARARREVYVGQWLPEPVSTERHPELVDKLIMADTLSFAFLILLQNLAPLERAVFLLREVFEYTYAEIAQVTDKSEANCRQVLHRAHQRLGEKRQRFTVSPEQQERMANQFLHTAVSGDVQGLLALLAEDVTFIGDANGKIPTALKPVHGASNVARGSMGNMKRLPPDIQASIKDVNGQKAIVMYVGGQTYGVMLMELDQTGARIQDIFIVYNPDKLHWLQ